MTLRVMEASDAIAEAVAVARPQVIAAYPITPQTHIVERLAKIVADGGLAAEFMTVESEHSALSAVLGASAAGARAYTATSSQGLLYMSEVAFDLAGMRLPVVMTVANRAISGPLSIWNDHQDAMALRDAGWIQLWAQTPQEACDLHLAAFRIAEDERVRLPVMVCVDGFVLTHAFEAIDRPSQAAADEFMGRSSPAALLDPDRPLTLGTYAEPALYTEARFAVEDGLRRSSGVIDETLTHLAAVLGRTYRGALDRYRSEDAEIVLVVMGTAAQTAREVVDALRRDGVAAGLVAIRTFRPFPGDELVAALARARRVVVLDRSVSLGAGGPVGTEVRAALAAASGRAEVVSVIAGLGGRDVSPATIRAAFVATRDGWIDLRSERAEVAS
jgi:pyruvate ferredoxin oxidoreductase alpha subunit